VYLGGKMAFKVQKDNTVATFDLRLAHSDLVDMMNDPQVSIDNGNVSATQNFEIVLISPNGKETIAQKVMEPTDKLVIRFKKVITTEVSDDLGTIDVLPLNN
jgi:hypothetical protein